MRLKTAYKQHNGMSPIVELPEEPFFDMDPDEPAKSGKNRLAFVQ